MNSLNSILVEGNLVADPLLKYTPNGNAVCNFSVATNRFYKDKSLDDGRNEGFTKEVSFFDVECWGKLAERLGTDVYKGRGLRVVGRLKQDRWTASDGKMHSKVKIVAEHVEIRPNFSNKPALEEAEAIDECDKLPLPNDEPTPSEIPADGHTIYDEEINPKTGMR